jgi:hypothetical protein
LRAKRSKFSGKTTYNAAFTYFYPSNAIFLKCDISQMRYFPKATIFYTRLMAVYWLLWFVLFYPDCLLISDEFAYFNRALCMAESAAAVKFDDSELIFFRVNNYFFPSGTAVYYALFVKLLGYRAVFFGNIVATTLSFELLIRILNKLNLPVWAALLLFMYLPAACLSRTLMSDPLSILQVCLFLYAFIMPRRSWWILGCLVGSNFLVRETVGVLLLLFLLPYFKEIKKIPFGLGVLLGLVARLGLAQLVYGDYWVLRPHSAFGFDYIIGNLLLLLLLFCLIYPLGAWCFVQYRGIFRQAFWWACLPFVVFHACYSYNGSSSGFLRSIVLYGRFFAPLLPFFVIIYATQIETWAIKKQWRHMVFAGCLVLIPSVQYAVWYVGKNIKGLPIEKVATATYHKIKTVGSRQ